MNTIDDLLATTDHKTILEWTRRNQGIPIMKSKNKEGVKEIAIDFSNGTENDDAVAVTWEEWLRVFDKRKLVFMYGDHINNEQSRLYYRLESRQSLVTAALKHSPQ
ncbi:MAG: hypothetical protein JST75_04295 [Bacteroidetes bacterium]|nr:hypothetical protein [Bacteroidota bacterium]